MNRNFVNFRLKREPNNNNKNGQSKRGREWDGKTNRIVISIFLSFISKIQRKNYGSALNFTQSFLILGSCSVPLPRSLFPFLFNAHAVLPFTAVSHHGERFLFFRQTGKNIRLRIIGLRALPLSLPLAVYAQYNLFRHHHSEQFTIWFFAVVVLWCLGFSCFDRFLSIFPFSFLFV